jgi:hypothetical protein
MISKRKQIETLAGDLRRRRETTEVYNVLALLNLVYDDAKETLVTATGDTVARAQGEAQAYKKLIALLTREPLAQTKE